MWKAINVAPDVYWCGIIDWNDRWFEGHFIDRGSTYNSYLIMDEKIVLIEPVEEKFAEQQIDYVKSVVDPAKIDYIISQHGELDHAGGLKKLLDVCTNATVITSDPMGVDTLKAYFGDDIKYQPVKTGDTLNIGKRTLEFVHTPMVHWPDNMVTYSAYDKILYSNDAFGQHMTTTKRFDYEVDLCATLEEAKAYYANIVWPYSEQAAAAVKAVKGLDIDLIMPSHGIIWKDHIKDIMDCYDKWDSGQNDGSAVVTYNSMYKSTYAMALAVVEAFTQCGIETRLFDLGNTHYSEVTPALLTAKYLAVGSSTHYRNMLPEVAEFLTFMKSLLPPKPNKVAFAFGSFGWSGEGAKEVNEVLKEANFDILMDPLSHKWTLDIEAMNEVCEQVKAAIQKQEASNA